MYNTEAHTQWDAHMFQVLYKGKSVEVPPKMKEKHNIPTTI